MNPHRSAWRIVPALLLCLGCQDDPVAAAEFRACSAEESPRELLRIEDATGNYRVFDLIDAVSVAAPYYGDVVVVDNCGGEPLRLNKTYGLSSGAAYLGGEVVLCSSRSALEGPGVWEILMHGGRGKELGLGEYCVDGPDSSFGFVTTDEGVVQYLPDGSSRKVPALSGASLTWLGDAGVVRGRDGLAVLPPGNAEAILVDGLPPVEFVVTQGNASSWVFLAAYSEPFFPPELGFPMLFALDLETGAWFETTEVTGDRLKTRNSVSVEAGLAAIVDIGLTLWRPEWAGPLPANVQNVRGVTVVDGERVVVATDDGLQLLRVPLERPEDEDVELEVVWSRPLADGAVTATSAGVPWKDVLLVEGTEDVWAYPLDGSEPYPFLPSLGYQESFFPTLGYTHLGTEYVTAMARNPTDRDDFWLYRNRLGGDVEVLDTDILGAPPENTSGFISEERYRWTADLGRILYAVRDGNTVSIRQHVLTD